MRLINETKNQHFLSQSELRLNAINPDADQSNQRIYSFSLVDRENYILGIDEEKGRIIGKSCCFRDLFSFDVLDRRKKRFNFENLFNQYESDIKAHTANLLSKLELNNSDIKPELLNIFVLKFLNFLRNPYSMKKVINTIGIVANYKPTDPDLMRLYKKIINGNRPQQNYLSSQFGITMDEYETWLRALFLLLVRQDDSQPNFLEQGIKGMYENPSHLVMVNIYHYDDEYENKRCLLSDRGLILPSPNESYLAFGFNLCSTAFVEYVFIDIDKAAPEETPKIILEACKNLPKSVNLRCLRNNLSALAHYNRLVIYQCHSKVYCSSKSIYGI